jgi:hypothetical protein
MMRAQSDKTEALLKALRPLATDPMLKPAVDYFESVQKVRIANTLSLLTQDQTGVFQGIQAVEAFAEDSDDVSDLDVLLNSNQKSDAPAVAAQRAYVALISDRFQLKVGLQDLRTVAGTPPPPPVPPGTIPLPKSGDLKFEDFNSYLADVETAINFIRDTNADLPSPNSLKLLLEAWQNVIEEQLPTASSDGGTTAPSGVAIMPTRAVLVDAYITVDSKVTELIDDITDILSDRNLQDLTIL